MEESEIRPNEKRGLLKNVNLTRALSITSLIISFLAFLYKPITQAIKEPVLVQCLK